MLQSITSPHAIHLGPVDQSREQALFDKTLTDFFDAVEAFSEKLIKHEMSASDKIQRLMTSGKEAKARDHAERTVCEFGQFAERMEKKMSSEVSRVQKVFEKRELPEMAERLGKEFMEIKVSIQREVRRTAAAFQQITDGR